uniref:Replication protein n=1 Tax=Adeno-associated virus TaxID=272636 RepID=A0A6B9PEE6_9VIRU|nr:replication protein [Adeno-associated virus]
MEFFSVVIKLPTDIDSDVPGVSENLRDEFYSADVPPPASSDMNPAEVDSPSVEMASRIVRSVRNFWREKVMEDFCDFFQLELSDDKFHIHCLFETKGTKGFVLGRYVPQFKERIESDVFGGNEISIPNWFKPRKTKQQGGANQTVNEGFILNYLLPKRQSELQWAWSNIERYERALLNLEERKRIEDEFKAENQRRKEQGLEPEFKPPRTGGSASDRYMELVNWLVEHGITNEKEWIQEDQESYIRHHTNSNGRAQIKSALDNAAKIMSLTKSAKDYLIGPCPPSSPEENRIYKIFQKNGYDPALAGSILVGWAKRQFGKRNAIWLYGPATTGKTNIAEAIAHAVPFYGCVNWTNENFPFNDCVDKMLIWWEEGKMTAKIVESAKAILGGSKVRVDQKCKSSQQIDSTPVIITSNTDMRLVVDGNQTTYEHKQPLEDRIFRFYLGKRLPDDFGKISKREVREFFKWAETNKVEVTPTFMVPVLGDHKRKRETDCEPFVARSSNETDALPDSLTEEESAPKKTRYEEQKTPAQIAYEQILKAIADDTPKPDLVHDYHDVTCKHGKHLFCADCDFNKNVKSYNKYLECPDSNKEQ